MAIAVEPDVRPQSSSGKTGIKETPYQRIRRKRRDAQLTDISISKNRHNSTNLPNYPGLDRWRLYAKIGDGAFSSVYRAGDSTTEFDEVAIKVVRKYEMNGHQVCERPTPALLLPSSSVPIRCQLGKGNSLMLSQQANTLKEVEIMRNINHAHAVRLIESFETRQYRYIVMELCPGGELYHKVTDLTHLSEDLTRHVMIQVASAVAYLHEALGVVHRFVGHFGCRLTTYILMHDIGISSRRIFSSFLYPLLRAEKSRNQDLLRQEMSTKFAKENLSPGSDPVELVQLSSQILV